MKKFIITIVAIGVLIIAYCLLTGEEYTAGGMIITSIGAFIFGFGLYLAVGQIVGTDSKTNQIGLKHSFRLVMPSKEKVKSAVQMGLIFIIMVEFLFLLDLLVAWVTKKS